MCLAHLEGQIVQVEALFREQLPTKYSFQYKILLGDVFINGMYWRDHTFVKYSKRWGQIEAGATVTFTARVAKYKHKGKVKYGLRHCRSVQEIEPNLLAA